MWIEADGVYLNLNSAERIEVDGSILTVIGTGNTEVVQVTFGTESDVKAAMTQIMSGIGAVPLQNVTQVYPRK